jgi:hypothetical protein
MFKPLEIKKSKIIFFTENLSSRGDNSQNIASGVMSLTI